MFWPDMRDNAHAYIHGDKLKKAEGHWFVYRWFIKGELTENWNPGYGQAIGGEKFKYIQFFCRGMLAPIGGVFGLISDVFNIAGTIPQSGYLFFIEYELPEQSKDLKDKLLPKIGDIIFTVKKPDNGSKPSPPLTFLEKYKILALVPSSGDFGRAEGWILHCDLDSNG